jgi:hypothetical protein
MSNVFPKAFVWTKIQAEAGQPLNSILIRKDLGKFRCRRHQNRSGMIGASAVFVEGAREGLIDDPTPGAISAFFFAAKMDASVGARILVFVRYRRRMEAG